MTRHRLLWTVSAMLMVIVVAGCKGRGDKNKVGRNPSAKQVAGLLEPNIISVHAYLSAMDCWIWNEDQTAPRGMVIKAMYLKGPSGKGVFGDGVIRPKLYYMQRDSEGNRQWHLATEWSYDVEQAMGYRTNREFLPGWGYRLHLPWPDTMDLSGREVRLIVEFERRDGITVRSGKTDRKVPLRGS